jgi:hypothetical protein
MCFTCNHEQRTNNGGHEIFELVAWMTQVFVQVTGSKHPQITPLFPNKSRRLAKLHGITHAEGFPQTLETSDRNKNHLTDQFTRHSRRPGPQVLGLHPPRIAEAGSQ